MFPCHRAPNMGPRIVLLGYGVGAFLVCGMLPAISQSQGWITCKNAGFDAKTKAVYPARAIEACTTIIQSGRENKQNLAQAYFLRGIAWFLNNRQIDRAVADYDEAIRLDPYHAYAYRNRGAIFVEKGEIDRAIADFDAAIDMNPNFALAYFNRAEAYDKKGNPERARVDYRMALAVLPKDTVTEGATRDWVRDHAYLRLSVVENSTPPAITSGAPPKSTRIREPLSLGTVSAPAKLGRRVALVIGNSAYVNVPRLANPTNDAQLMAETLRTLGFSLVGGGAELDLNEQGLRRVVQDFGSQLQGADVGLFYYAGHGVQVHGANYLVPVDANPIRQADVDFQTLDANLVLRQMEGAGTKLNLVILDACRNNPFGGRGLRTTDGGLAQMHAPEGTLISFATQPGKIALDGIDGHSPYTAALAQIIRRPGLDLFRTFNEVGLAVESATRGAQEPWVSHSPIKGDFYFAGAPVPSGNPRP